MSDRASRMAARIRRPRTSWRRSLELRPRHPSWGAKKLLSILEQRHPRWDLPGALDRVRDPQPQRLGAQEAPASRDRPSWPTHEPDARAQ